MIIAKPWMQDIRGGCAMKKAMKKFVKLAAVSMTALAAVSGAAQAAPLYFPDPEDGVVSLQYGQFTVYSLAMLNYYAMNGKTSPPSNNDPYYVKSAPGQINEFIVIATGSKGVSNGEFANTDNPFLTPSGGGSGSSVFWTTTSPDPSDTFGADALGMDNAGTWDISLETLRDYLKGQKLFFGFNLNETDSAGSELLTVEQDALAWGRVTLVDLDTGAEVSFIFDGTNSNDAIQSQTLFTHDGVDWGRIHGQICVAKVSDGQTPQLLHLGPCTGDDVNGVTINQNLGADRVAFALTNDELSALIYNTDFDVMRVEMGLADINNGYEQLFIFGLGQNIVPDPDPVPEPAGIALLGLGILGIAAARRGKKAA